LIWAGRCECVDSSFLYRYTHPENQELRMKLPNIYEHLKQTDTQLLHHNDTHIKLKQRIIELNNKVEGQDLIDYKQKLAIISDQS
jgi:hypothetical protein